MLMRNQVFIHIVSDCLKFPIKVHRAGLKYTEIPSIERERIGGESKVNAFFDGIKILWYTLKWKFKS